MFMGRRFIVRHFVPMACVAGFSIFLVMSFPLNSVAQGSTRDNREALPDAPSGTWNTVDESFRGSAVRGTGLVNRFAYDHKAIMSCPLYLRSVDTLIMILDPASASQSISR